MYLWFIILLWQNFDRILIKLFFRYFNQKLSSSWFFFAIIIIVLVPSESWYILSIFALSTNTVFATATHRTWAITEYRNIGTCFPINNRSSVGSSVGSSVRSYIIWIGGLILKMSFIANVLLSLQLLLSKYVLLIWDQYLYFLIFLKIKFLA